MDAPTSDQLFLGILYISFKRFSENLEYLVNTISKPQCVAYTFASSFRSNLNIEFHELTYSMFTKHLTTTSSIEGTLLKKCEAAKDQVEGTVKDCLEALRAYNTTTWKKKIMAGRDLMPFKTRFSEEIQSLTEIQKRISGVIEELESDFPKLKDLEWNLGRYKEND